MVSEFTRKMTFKDEAFYIKGLKKNSFLIKDIEDQTPELQLVAVSQNAWAIEYIKNPVEEAQLIAVKQDPQMIKYIRNPTKEVQLVVVQERPFLINFIKNPSVKVQMAAIEKDYKIVEKNYIKNISREAQQLYEKKYAQDLKKQKTINMIPEEISL